ncbi:hypothetical protein NUW58_g8658 [Xylaria curta]|uniref:Uncharacterized protein n=1 Tax=Xylaria curta TaxID=42375 RepID=A0ACC1N611_9PEZI|nr:hypothetical protein NUW58_g8658 [Xylaria curta]
MEDSTLDLDEQPAKRQRLDIDEEEQQANDDEAVLALAADGITDAYGPPEPGCITYQVHHSSFILFAIHILVVLHWTGHILSTTTTFICYAVLLNDRHYYSMATGKGSNKVKWTGDAYKALAIALARIHGTITPEQQEAVVADMTVSGFQTTWEGIR